MATIAGTDAPEVATPTPLPPLENGDRLTRPEFERRYEAMPHLKKAELIEGVVYMPSPVTHRRHGRPHLHVGTWLGNYLIATPGVDGGDNSSLRLDLDNEPQPDLFLYISRAYGGQAEVDAQDYIVGGPELIVEIAASSVSFALHGKKGVYRRHGAQEYVVWRTRDEEIDWFVLREGRYERLAPGTDGIYRSEVFPGLWLDAPALIRGDLAAVNRVLQEGLATPEHSALASRLQTALAG
jgi:hypothetical protein